MRRKARGKRARDEQTAAAIRVTVCFRGTAFLVHQALRGALIVTRSSTITSSAEGAGLTVAKAPSTTPTVITDSSDAASADAADSVRERIEKRVVFTLTPSCVLRRKGVALCRWSEL